MTQEEALAKDKQRAKKILSIVILVNLVMFYCFVLLMARTDIKDPILNWLPIFLGPIVSTPPLFLLYWLINMSVFKKKDFKSFEPLDFLLFLPNYKNWVEKHSGC